jgi:squalene-hopene/tetraprenyl-beta-curcumene cyclase
MRKNILSFCAFALFTTGALRAQDLAATWQGTLPIGEDQHRVVIEIAKKDGGRWAATCYVEFLRDDVHVDSIVVNSSSLKLTMNGGVIAYEGKTSSDRSSIAGTWTYDHRSVPLELRRAAQESAWHVPFLYQYHLKDVTYLRPSAIEPRIAFTPKLALDYIEQGAEAWTSEWKCVACHTNGSYMVVRPLLTPELGPPNPQLREFFVTALRQQLTPDPDDPRWAPEPTQVVYIAAGLAIWDAHVTHHLSPETAQALAFMFSLQSGTGDWPISDDNNPPLESSTFQLATVAARAVGNAPGWLAQQVGTPEEGKIRLLKDLLRSERKIQGDYDRTDLLWAATEFPGLLEASRMQQLVQMIFSHERPDGGWSIRNFALPEEWGKGNRAQKLRAEPEFSDPPSDGHMTGLAIIALRKAGVGATDPHIQRGISWLLANQRSSGRWWTRSLNRDGWQFITYSGTVYPLLALAICDALPPSTQMGSVPLSARSLQGIQTPRVP